MNHRQLRLVPWFVFALVWAAAVQGWSRSPAAEAPNPAEARQRRERAAADFANADGDGNARLTLHEFVLQMPKATAGDGKRRFLAFDFDGDGGLDASEFQAAVAPTDERPEVPDPMVQMAQADLAKWRELAAASDKDGDGKLSAAEWPASRIESEIPRLAGVAFNLWDRDRDGNVDADEARWLLDVAYGATQLNGRPLRSPTGRVFSWYYFRHLDENSDGILSYEEFVSRHHSGREKNAAVFRELDADEDEKLTDQETWALLWHDTLANFFDYDGNRDGYLTTDEFLAIGWGTSAAQHSVRAFDDDGDEKISFREFRGTTFANQASGWPIPRRDADDDGRLSWKEFYTEKTPLLFAQARWFFDRFDTDKDGYLSLGELEFDVNIDKVPPDALFLARDTDADGKLVLSEVFTEKKPPAGDAREADRYEMRLAAAESRFLTDDQDGNGSLDLKEFIDSQQAAIEAARRQSKSLAQRKSMLEGNYWLRKGVLIFNEIAFLAVVVWVVRRSRPAQRANPDEQTE